MSQLSQSQLDSPIDLSKRLFGGLDESYNFDNNSMGGKRKTKRKLNKRVRAFPI
jgi:hypothetical protein